MIDIFRGCLLAQAGKPQPGDQAFAVSFEGFALDEHGQAVLKAEVGGIGMPPLLLEGAGHADKAEFAQAVCGGVGQHGCSPQ